MFVRLISKLEIEISFVGFKRGWITRHRQESQLSWRLLLFWSLLPVRERTAFLDKTCSEKTTSLKSELPVYSLPPSWSTEAAIGKIYDKVFVNQTQEKASPWTTTVRIISLPPWHWYEVTEVSHRYLQSIWNVRAVFYFHFTVSSPASSSAYAHCSFCFVFFLPTGLCSWLFPPRQFFSIFR